MKKVVSIIAFVLACSMLVVGISGSSANTETRVIEYYDEGVTVVFENAVYSSEERYTQIADRLVYGDEYATSAISWCWLFGHDIESNTIQTITHNVRSVSPKCLRKTYKIETCSKCDYYNEELLTSVYIVCH